MERRISSICLVEAVQLSRRSDERVFRIEPAFSLSHRRIFNDSPLILSHYLSLMKSAKCQASSAFSDYSDSNNFETDFSSAVVANVVLNGIRPYALPQEEEDYDVLEAEPPRLILYNDEVNTFEHVIVSLVDVCGHEEIQAEQCAWIVHTRGRCSIKEGSPYELEPMADALCRRGLSANVE